jgi:hypothetical protein
VTGGIDHNRAGRILLRRIASFAVAGAALLAAFGCGTGGNDANVSSGPGGEHRHVAVADANHGSGLKTVTYGNVKFDVPADWPVHDLAADPSTCVRFDVHAVYLGQPGADMSCPAGLVGRADAILVEPTDSRAYDRGAAAAGAAAATASGLEVHAADDATGRELDADLPSAGVSVTLPYQDSNATAQQILQSFRSAS